MEQQGRSAQPDIDELLRRIAAEYDKLPRQLKRIASYIDEHRSRVIMDRASDIAGHCEVHPSAVVRFAQRFGFSGFSGLQALFKHAYAGADPGMRSYRNRIRKLVGDDSGAATGATVARQFIEASRAGLEQLAADIDDERFEAAVSLLEHAGNIYVIGVRRSFAAATYLAYQLQHTAKRVHLLTGLGGTHREQIRSAGPGDVVVAISFAPYGKEPRHCLRAARRNKAQALLITDSLLSPLTRDADVSLTVREGSAFAFRSLTGTICLCQALFVALACRLELNVEEIQSSGDDDD